MCVKVLRSLLKYEVQKGVECWLNACKQSKGLLDAQLMI